MDAVLSQIATSAHVLGLAPDSALVAEAKEVASEAVRCGYPEDVAVDLGRGILLRATQPGDTLAVA